MRLVGLLEGKKGSGYGCFVSPFIDSGSLLDCAKTTSFEFLLAMRS